MGFARPMMTMNCRMQTSINRPKVNACNPSAFCDEHLPRILYVLSELFLAL
jgi:hypothetical protein